MHSIKGFIFINQPVKKNAGMYGLMAGRSSPIDYRVEILNISSHALSFPLLLLKMTSNIFKLLHKTNSESRKALG